VKPFWLKKGRCRRPSKSKPFAGKVHVEWAPTAAVAPIGQLPFFIEFLKLGHRFNPWVEECPLHYGSHNALQKIDVLGSLFLSILSGHNRYAHMTALRGRQRQHPTLGHEQSYQ
jgi:hypothetical protein